ncbi:MAG TPA: response regulator transcription factor [Solirubrobacteraceae bacterium]|nr:response regulator transcription factor [Solirubrobacteraceae bacterium]
MPRTDAVTILLSRFEDLVALGLRALVAQDPHLQIVADDVPVEALPAALVEHRPRVAIVNFGSLRTSVEVHHLASAHKGTRLLVLANRPSPAEANQMLSFGATACLSKETQARDILNVIHLASRGLQVLPRSATPLTPEPPGPEMLTPREAEVLDHLRAGASNAQIAQALHVSIETVRTHARSVFRKLGVASRRELRNMGR